MPIKFKATKAVRKNVYVKVFLTGIAGSGKTLTALKLATGMANEIEAETGTRPNIAMFNTEASRGLYNAGEYDYYIFPDEDTEIEYEKYTPELYLDWMNWANEELSVNGVPPILLIDGITPAWDAMKAAQIKAGGSYKDWSKITPRWNALTSAIVRTKNHMIVCARGKKKNEIENDNGKITVRKLGVGAEVRENLDFEFTCAFTLDLETHNADVDKDNIGFYDSRVSSMPLDENDGVRMIKWANSGVSKNMEELEKIKAKKASDVDVSKMSDNNNTVHYTTKKQAVSGIKEVVDKKLSECADDDTKEYIRSQIMNVIKKYVSDNNGSPIADYRLVDSIETAEKLIGELKEIGGND